MFCCSSLASCFLVSFFIILPPPHSGDGIERLPGRGGGHLFGLRVSEVLGANPGRRARSFEEYIPEHANGGVCSVTHNPRCMPIYGAWKQYKSCGEMQQYEGKQNIDDFGHV